MLLCGALGRARRRHPVFSTSFAASVLACSLALAGLIAALQKKHVECAELLLGSGTELTTFVARLMDDIANLKAMLQAISIGGC